jgi:hypothetical protein
MVEVLIEEMYGSACNRPLDYERTALGEADPKDSQGRGRKTLLSGGRSVLEKEFDWADIVRDVRTTYGSWCPVLTFKWTMKMVER